MIGRVLFGVGMFTLCYVIDKAVGGTRGADNAQLRLEADAENRVVST